jgi:DNA-binding transcriptional MocR family regulator
MDRETIKQYLDQTEKHLDTSDKLVQDQKALIALLGERGRATAQSKTTLAHLEEMRRLHVADRDRLLQALREFEE